MLYSQHIIEDRIERGARFMAEETFKHNKRLHVEFKSPKAYADAKWQVYVRPTRDLLKAVGVIQ